MYNIIHSVSAVISREQDERTSGENATTMRTRRQGNAPTRKPGGWDRTIAGVMTGSPDKGDKENACITTDNGPVGRKHTSHREGHAGGVLGQNSKKFISADQEATNWK